MGLAHERVPEHPDPDLLDLADCLDGRLRPDPALAVAHCALLSFDFSPFARYYESPHDREENPLDEDIAWYLGPRPHDHAVRADWATSPSTTNESTAVKVRRAVDGLGDLMDDYEFHYPGELNPDNLDEVREALDGHGIARSAPGSTRIRGSGAGV